MKKILLIILISVAAGFAEAHDGNNGWVTVNNMQLWSNTYLDPQIRVVLTGDTYYNPAVSCASVDSYMVSTALTEKQQDRIYSTMLSAVMAKKSIMLRLDTNNCENGRPRIINVAIQ